MRHLIHQINDKTTPFNIYILVFVNIWIFVKLLVLLEGICRKLTKINQKWRLFVYIAHNNAFIVVCLCLKVVLRSGLIYMIFIFLVLFFVLQLYSCLNSSLIFTKFGSFLCLHSPLQSQLPPSCSPFPIIMLACAHFFNVLIVVIFVIIFAVVIVLLTLSSTSFFSIDCTVA